MIVRIKKLSITASLQINIVKRIETNNETLLSLTVTEIELINIPCPTPPS